MTGWRKGKFEFEVEAAAGVGRIEEKKRKATRDERTPHVVWQSNYARVTEGGKQTSRETKRRRRRLFINHKNARAAGGGAAKEERGRPF